MTFLPTNYDVPSSSDKYFKFKSGDNRFRILSKPVIGWEYWTNESKPVRLKDLPETTPTNIKLDKFGAPTATKHFWSMIVWNYEAKRIQELSITQMTIQRAITDLANDPDWGSPLKYDLKVKKTGENLKTEYFVVTAPKSEISDEVKAALESSDINLDSVFESNVKENEESEQSSEPMLRKSENDNIDIAGLPGAEDHVPSVDPKSLPF